MTPTGPRSPCFSTGSKPTRTGWARSQADLDAARRICAALDGLPLAIELAAARARAFGLPEIAVHLQQRLDILGDTPQGSLSAHRTLQAAIAWSVDQLLADDRALLLRLWPFEGGFTWQAAQAVQPSDPPGGPVLATLAALVDRSLITADFTTEHPRYRMLETLRRYCQSEDPNPTATAAAQAAWIRDFVTDQAALLTGSRSGEAFSALRAELPNIRAGIAHDLQRAPLQALRTTGELLFMWVTVGAIEDGVSLIKAALSGCPAAPVADRVRGLVALSMATFHSGDAEEALRLADEAIALLGDCTDAGDHLYLEAHSRRCNALADLDRPEELREAALVFKAEADRRGTGGYLQACARLGVAVTQLRDGDVAGASATFLEAQQISRSCGFLWGEGITEVLLAWGLLRQPRPRETTLDVLHRLSRAVAAFDRQPNISDALGALYAGAFALADLGERESAATLRAAVAEHAARAGTDPGRYAPPDVEEQMGTLLEGAEVAADRQPLSWPQMVALFTRAVDALR